MSKEGREQYMRDVARSARTPRSRGGIGPETLPGGKKSGGGAAKGREAIYYYNPKTGHYTYRVGGESPGSGWQRLASKPKGLVGGQTRGVATDIDKEIAQLQGGSRATQLTKEGEYYYNPITGAISKQEVEGQKPMTKREAEYYRKEYTSKGLSPYQTSGGKQLTKKEHRRQHEEYLRAKKHYEKFPYVMELGGRIIPLTKGMAGKYRALSLRETLKGIQEQKQGRQDIKVYRKGEYVTYRVGQEKPEGKGWYEEALIKGVPTPKIKERTYEPTAWGGMKLAWSKLKTFPDIVWEKVQKKYTSTQLLKGAQSIGGFSKSLTEELSKPSELIPLRILSKKTEPHLWELTQEIYPVQRMAFDVKRFNTLANGNLYFDEAKSTAKKCGILVKWQ